MIIALSILAMENPDDRQFMENLYQKYRPLMFRIAREKLKSHHDAEDAIGEACLKMIPKVEKLRTMDDFNLRLYLMSVIRNTSIDKSIERNKEQEYVYLDGDDGVFDAIEGGVAADIALLQESGRASLVKALSCMPKNQLDLLIMKYYDQLEDDEIAKILHIKTDSVRMYLSRAKRRACRILREERADNE